MAPQFQKETVQQGEGKYQAESGFQTGRNPLRTACPQVLGRIGTHGIANGRHGDHAQPFHPHSGGKTGQGFRTEPVDHRLDQHHADGDRGLLKDGRQGDPGHGQQFFGSEETGLFGRHAPEDPGKDPAGQESGDPLGDESGPGYAGNSQPVPGDQNPIQPHIEEGGKIRKNRGIRDFPGR